MNRWEYSVYCIFLSLAYHELLYLLQYHPTLYYKTHLFGRVDSLQFIMYNSLNDSKDVNILSGRPLDRLFPDIFNISRFFSEDTL